MKSMGLRTWQARLPGSVTECPEKLPEIDLFVPEFLTATSLHETRVTTACWMLAEARELSICGFTHGYSYDKTLGTQQASKCLPSLSTLISVNQEKSEVCSS